MGNKAAPAGRLVTLGDGRLFIQPENNGQVSNSLHGVAYRDSDGNDVPADSVTFDKKLGKVVDGDGNEVTATGTDELAVELVEVKWNHDEDGFVIVEPGQDSHNDEFHENFKTVDGTSGPLYDAQGKQVYEGDEHHDHPTEDDAHFVEGAANHTVLTEDSDDVAPKVTGHTEAYSNA